MREILFRGKRIDNEDWTEGHLIKEPYDYCIQHYETVDLNNFRRIKIGVVPETVGQYTGLTDKNGKKIFEGDIVRQYNEGLDNEYLYDLSADIGRVFWYQEGTRFLRTSKLFPDDCPKICAHCEYEIIGNVHDNPELLEE